MMEHGIKMGRDALFDVLAQHHLLIKRRKRVIASTLSGAYFHILKKRDSFTQAPPSLLFPSLVLPRSSALGIFSDSSFKKPPQIKETK